MQCHVCSLQCSVCTMNYAVYSIEFAVCSSKCRLFLHLSQLSSSFTRASPSCWDASIVELRELRGSDVCSREEFGGTQEAPAVYAGTSSFPAIIQFFTARSLLPLVSSSTTCLCTMSTILVPPLRCRHKHLTEDAQWCTYPFPMQILYFLW